MLEYFISDARALQRYRSGPLGQHLDQFAKLLKEAGYTRLSGQGKLRVAVALNQWLVAKRLSLRQINDRQLRSFQADRRKRLSSHHRENGTLALLIDSAASTLPA